jgi:uncharacterized protein YpuA (DUF1002 family)
MTVLEFNQRTKEVIMKHSQITFALLAATLCLFGCSKSSTVDTAPLEKSFASADATLKSSADKAIAAIKESNYQSALTEVQKLASNAKLTDDQKKAVNDVLAQIQKAVSEMADKAAGEAKKAVGDLQNSLKK